MAITELKPYLSNIAEKLKSLLGITDKINAQDFVEKIDEVYEQGKKSQYDEFWDKYQDNGNRTDYDMAFGSVGWTDATFKPKYKIKPVESAHRMFQDSLMTGDLTQCGVEIDFSECQQMQMTFYNTKFKKVGVINALSTTTLNSTFSYSTELETIEKLIVKDDGSVNIQTNTFQSCASLQNVSIEGKIGKSVSFAQSSKLTDESLISIINSLKELNAGTTATLTLHATSKSKLTEADIATITQKGWTLA